MIQKHTSEAGRFCRCWRLKGALSKVSLETKEHNSKLLFVLAVFAGELP